MKPTHVWIVEYGTGANWYPDVNRNEELSHFKTRKLALHSKKWHHEGHPSNLRVRKYIRVEK